MESLKTMHIKRFVAHLLTFRHTVYYRIWFFCRPFRRTGREHHKTSDKPPPAGVGSRDGLLYVYHTADCSPLWCVVGCVVLYRTRRRPLVRCRSPPNVQDSQKFLNDLEDKTMRYRNNGQIEEELQIRFTGYLGTLISALMMIAFRLSRVRAFARMQENILFPLPGLPQTVMTFPIGNSFPKGGMPLIVR